MDEDDSVKMRVEDFTPLGGEDSKIGNGEITT